jgi:HlyD family secretion protein
MWKWFVMVLAIAGAIFAITLSRRSVAETPVPPPLKTPVRNPFPSGIAGAGLVEASSENVVIGVSEQGLVTKMYIKEGQGVKAGEPLFEIDSRSLQAQLITSKAALVSAEAELARTEAYRRKEEEAPLRAQVAQAEASLEEARRNAVSVEKLVAEAEWSLKNDEAKMRRLEVAVKANAAPAEDLENTLYAVKLDAARVATATENVQAAKARIEVAKTAIDQAKGQLNIFLAGAWGPDVEKAKAAVGEARARIEQLNVEIERRIIRAPIDGNVMRLNLRQGEYAPVGSVQAEDAPLVLGDIKTRNVRIDIDEFDVRRYKVGAKAIAFLKGGSDKQIPLEFVRVEPFVIPKRALTNSQRELVDTRVLQVIYKISDAENAVYPGQQLDVYIEAPAETEAPPPPAPAAK